MDERTGITWHDNPQSYEVDLGGRFCCYYDLEAILHCEFRMGSFIEHPSIRAFDSSGRRVYEQDMYGSLEYLPKGHDTEVVPGGWDHEHCMVSQCWDKIMSRPNPASGIGWYCPALNWWLCCRCHDFIEAHRDELERGLAARLHLFQPIYPEHRS